MKNIIIYLTLVVTIVALYGFAFTLALNPENDGKKIFIDNKCNMCHTVNSVGIESKKSDAVDLSSVGKDQSTEVLMKFLKKEGKINEKDHKTTFKGSDEDLKVLVDWLLTLKGE